MNSTHRMLLQVKLYKNFYTPPETLHYDYQGEEKALCGVTGWIHGKEFDNKRIIILQFK